MCLVRVMDVDAAYSLVIAQVKMFTETLPVGALATQDVGHCPGAPVNERGTQSTCSELKEFQIVPHQALTDERSKNYGKC